MVVRRMTVKVGQQPTEEQKRWIRESIDRPIAYDVRFALLSGHWCVKPVATLH